MNNDHSDSGALQLIRQGGSARAKGIATLYRSYAPAMKHFFINRGATQASAEDLAQEVFIQVIRKIDDYRGDGALSAWLWSIARNCAISEHRKANSRPPSANDEADDFDQLPAQSQSSNDALNDCVRQAFHSFAKTHSDRAHTLSLHAFHGWNIEDVATFLGRTRAATREYLSQCRKKLSPFLQRCQEFIHP